MRTWIAAAALVAAAPAAAQTTDGISIPGIKARVAAAYDIKSAMLDSAEGWNRGDIDRFLAVYSDDPATSFTTSSGVARGKAGIRARYLVSYAEQFGGRASAPPLELSFDFVEFRLLRPGNVVLLWVKPRGEVDVYWPIRSGDRSERRAGRHGISTTEVPSPVQAPVISGAPEGRTGQFASPRGNVLSAAAPAVPTDTVTGYWVLVVLDAPITAKDVQKRLAPMTHEGGASAVLERIAPA